MARKTFDIPSMYHASIIKTIKDATAITDPRKKELEPTVLHFGPVDVLIPRHFGFCYGVENAIDIAYRTLDENPGKRVYFLSEMIHNPTVNEDLERRGVQFLYETDGSVRIPMSELTAEDIVVVPAFGTTLEIEQSLKEIGIDPYSYNTTCPFVEKVWKRGHQLGKKGYSLVIHGKHQHEETRATFSHSASHSPTVVVLNPEEAQQLADIVTGDRPIEDFEPLFRHKATPGFDPLKDLKQFGVINQTTMLATETQQVMEILKKASETLATRVEDPIDFADTNDTLCYATNENQSATLALAKAEPDLALVVGGYNSSNTMHLVEILEHVCPTFHVRDVSELESPQRIHHFNQWTKQRLTTNRWLDGILDDHYDTHSRPLQIALNSGASCPDVLVDEVLLKLLEWFDETYQLDCAPLEEVMAPYQGSITS